jgi:type IV secretory pathway VirB10-like protein
LSSPSFLPPQPKRGPGVRRLNHWPIYIGVGAAACVAGAVGYTLYARSQHAAAQQIADSKKATAGRASVLDNAPSSGIIQATLALHKVELPPARTTQNPYADAPAPTMQPVLAQPTMNQSGTEDVATQARRAAWMAYYAQLAELQKRRSDARLEGMVADISAGSTATGNAAPSQMGYAQPGLPPGGVEMGGGMMGSPYGPALPDATGAREKQAFLAQQSNPGNDTLLAVVRDPISPYLVTAGDVIPATMQGGADSDTPGQITGRVSTDVCDSATGQYLLIPAESKLVGTYDNVVSAGQSRLPAAITRIIFPDTSSINIGGMPTADQGGYAGMQDQLNRHLLEKFGNAMIVAVAAGGIQLSQPQSRGNNGYDSQQIIAGGLGQQFGQLGQEVARAGLAVPNTISIRPGYAFTLKVTKDIVLRPYVDRRGPSAQPGGCSASPQYATQQASFGPAIQ